MIIPLSSDRTKNLNLPVELICFNVEITWSEVSNILWYDKLNIVKIH